MKIAEFNFNPLRLLFGLSYVKRDWSTGHLFTIHFLFWCLLLEFGRPKEIFIDNN